MKPSAFCTFVSEQGEYTWFVSLDCTAENHADASISSVMVGESLGDAIVAREPKLVECREISPLSLSSSLPFPVKSVVLHQLSSPGAFAGGEIKELGRYSQLGHSWAQTGFPVLLRLPLHMAASFLRCQNLPPSSVIPHPKS